MKMAAVLLLSGLAACAPTSRISDADILPKTQLAEAQLSTVTTEIENVCGLPRGTLSENKPAASLQAVTDKVDCICAQARQHGVAIGFISNPVDPDGPVESTKK